MDETRLLAFAGSFFLVALSPGLCMTSAMSLGISIGIRRVLWWIAGELCGVMLVGACAALGAAALLSKTPALFAALKWVGAAYLLYAGWQTWRAEPARPDQPTGAAPQRPWPLIAQGFVTATSNPKAWAFFVALLPPFIDRNRPFTPQLLSLLGVMLLIEFTCLQIYANGGRALAEQLHRRGKARWLNRIAGCLMMAVGVWLALE